MRRERRERKQVVTVVLEDAFDRTGIPRTEESEIARRDFEARYVALSMDAKDRAFERSECATRKDLGSRFPAILRE